MKRLAIALLTLALLCLAAFAAAETVDLTITVTYGQTEARSMLETINAHRTADTWYWNETDTEKIPVTGLAPLEYDYELEKTAMQRAAELAIYYSHTRPNGERCFTIYPSGALGENIAAGYGTAASVFDAWWEEYSPYAGQGHRRNLLNEGASRIGIGHTICGGVHFWVQCIGYKASGTATAAADDTRQVTVQVLTSNIVNIGASMRLEVDETQAIPAPGLRLTETWPAGRYCTVEGLTVSGWNAPEDGIASVAEDGVTGLAVGETSISGTAAIPGATQELAASLAVSVSAGDINSCEIKLDDGKPVYTGKEIEPSVTVTSSRGKLLTEGTDYTLTYEDNIDADVFSRVFVKGEGNYTGTARKSFIIVPADISKAVFDPLPAVTFDGTYHYCETNNLSATFNGKKLKPSSDFYVSTTENDYDAGTASVTVMGSGNFSGMTTLTFEILPFDISGEGKLEIEASGTTESSFIRPVVTVTLDGFDYYLIEDTDYTKDVQLDADGNGTVTVTGIGNYTGTLTGTFKLDKPGDEDDPDDPGTPSDPTNPTDPTNPGDPTVPTDPTNPGDPTVDPAPATPTTATVGALKYSLKGSAATVTGPKSKSAKKLTIPATIKVNGKTYKVTAIQASAFKSMKKLTTVVIGKNVKTIGKNAFYKCAKLKSITIKTTKLTTKTVGANAFKGVYKKVTVKVPAKKLKAYKTLLKKKGLPKTAKVKK